MKFDSIVGNPPYTVSVGGGNQKSVYQEYFKKAFEIGRVSSVVSPARWFNSMVPSMKTFRRVLVEEGLAEKFESIFFLENSRIVFPGVEIGGGVAWWLFDEGSDGDTEFVVNGMAQEPRSLVFVDGTIVTDVDRIFFLNRVSESRAKLKVLGFLNEIQEPFLKLYGSASTKTMLEYTTKYRVESTDYRLRVHRHGWRYVSENVLEEGKSVVPRDKYALAFTHASSNNVGTLNDKTFFLQGGETAKSTMAVIVDTPNQAFRLYKYARTKFFRRLVEGRLSSHHTFPQAYQDVPNFNFDDTDPIDWNQSIPKIDAQLEAHFGLEELHDWLQAVTEPFARPPEEEYLEEWRELGVDVTSVDEWY